MREERIFYDGEAFVYFARQADKEMNIDYIKTLDSYQKRKYWRMSLLIPSLFFTLFFVVSFIFFLLNSEPGETKSLLLGLFGLMTGLSIYVAYDDIKTFRTVFYPKKEPSFLFGQMVDRVTRKKKRGLEYFILLEVDAETDPQILAIKVPKSKYLDAETGDSFWIFSEKYNLYAIKNK